MALKVAAVAAVLQEDMEILIGMLWEAVDQAAQELPEAREAREQ
jgi:hypothetical protein